MAAHSSLTGADLHEPKGADAATADQVYISDGAGSGDWTDTSLLNTFGAKFFHAREQQVSGAAGTYLLTEDTWNTLVLNTEITDDIGITLASNTLPLSAGTYYVKSNVGFKARTNTLGRMKIYNNTDSADLVLGPCRIAAAINSDNAPFDLFVEGRFTLATAKTISARYWLTGTVGDANTRMVPSAIASTAEVYGEIFLWKVA